MRFLRTQQDEAGYFAPPDTRGGRYAHELATRTFVVGFEMTYSPILRKSVVTGLHAIDSLRETTGLWTKTSEDVRLDVLMALPYAELEVYVRQLESRGKTPRIRPAPETIAAIRTWAMCDDGPDTDPVLRAGRLQVRGLLGEEWGTGTSLAAAREAHGRLPPPKLGLDTDVLDLTLGLDAHRWPVQCPVLFQAFMRHGAAGDRLPGSGWPDAARMVRSRDRGTRTITRPSAGAAWSPQLF